MVLGALKRRRNELLATLDRPKPRPPPPTESVRYSRSARGRLQGEDEGLWRSEPRWVDAEPSEATELATADWLAKKSEVTYVGLHAWKLASPVGSPWRGV